MKRIYTLSGITIVCVLLYCFSAHLENRGTIKISYSEDRDHNMFTATYPDEVSGTVISHINQWAGGAVQKSGQLSETLNLKFSNGISCQVHAKGRKLEIIADRAGNSSTALASLKDEGKIINDLILAEVNRSR